MKDALIQKYHDLAEITKNPMVVGWTAALIDLHRIDAILWERYGYDVSLTRKF